MAGESLLNTFSKPKANNIGARQRWELCNGPFSVGAICRNILDLRIVTGNSRVHGGASDYFAKAEYTSGHST